MQGFRQYSHSRAERSHSRPAATTGSLTCLDGIGCRAFKTCRRQPQTSIQSLESPLKHREAAERECTEAKRRVDSAKPNPKGAQASAREPKRSELYFVRLLSERAFTSGRGASPYTITFCRSDLLHLPPGRAVVAAAAVRLRPVPDAFALFGLLNASPSPSHHRPSSQAIGRGGRNEIMVRTKSQNALSSRKHLPICRNCNFFWDASPIHPH